MYYLSYGMNTNLESMKARCPNAEPMGGFYLPNYRLVFRGVADLVPEDDCVAPVVLWKITTQCLRSLDRVEGYPTLYNRRKINSYKWICYFMVDSTALSPPSHGYYRMIGEGYRDFGLDTTPLRLAADEAGFKYVQSV
jgi:hypothetical protein